MSVFLHKNEPFSALTHLIGFFLSIAALVLLVVFASLYGTAWHVVGMSIFGATLILLYLASTIFHFIPKRMKKLKAICKRIDQSFIYVLIAGTYTPITLTKLRGPWGWSLFGIIWGIAIIGVLLKSFGRINDVASTLIYIAMGWIIVIALYPLLKVLPMTGFLWLLAGGVFYTLGTIFLALERIFPRKNHFWFHEVFHLFVIAGSFSHFWLMLKYVL
ncbi:hemolysin III family protein [Candidatus Woesearchaeota archaeon]|nr:hemolysin III family protein [Candidatus Woesearchaeota archaeon]